MQTYDELLAEANQHYAMAHHHMGKVKIVLDLMNEARPASRLAPVNAPVRCVREWTDWLGVNGPSLKGDIHDGTGIKFTERGSKYTVEWARSLVNAPDDLFAPNTLMKISGQSKGRGAPPKIYFLWSQRYDVHPLFGVGPIWDEEAALREQEAKANQASRLQSGVISMAGFQPVVDGAPTFHDFSVTTGEGNGFVIISEPTDGPFEQMIDFVHGPSEEFRCATMEEWDAAWAPYFDTLVASDTKPTDTERKALRDTVPEGEDGNAAIAIAHRAAVERAQSPQPMLGVIQPPVASPHALADGPWEEQPLDWGAEALEILEEIGPLGYGTDEDQT